MIPSPIAAVRALPRFAYLSPAEAREVVLAVLGAVDVNKVARAIANGLGDSYDHAFGTKIEWNAARGEKGGRYRDINEPFQQDYDDAARAAIDALVAEVREEGR